MSIAQIKYSVAVAEEEHAGLGRSQWLRCRWFEPTINKEILKMLRYLLTLLLALLTLSACGDMDVEDADVESSTAALVEDETSTAGLIEDGAYLCNLTAADDVFVLGSGCFVFESTKDGYGRATGILEVPVPGIPPLVSRWKCSYGASQPEEFVECYGYGMGGYNFTAIGSGSLMMNPGVGEPDLVLNTTGITGDIIGTGGVARCFVDSACAPDPE